MDQKFFRIPFASAGDKQQIPDEKNAEGFVSFIEGWGEDYQKDLMSDADAKAVERDAMNSILNAITFALRQYQTDAFPEWITPANNGGTAYQYGAGVVVRHRQGNGAFTSYVSLADNNTTEPGTKDAKWQGFIYRRASQDEADAGTDDTLIITPPTLKQAIKNAIGDITTELAPFLLPVGVITAWGATVPPDGWIEANGQAFDVAKNPKLHAVYPSGHVPDARGRFISGWAHGSAEDPDPNREMGSYQPATDLNHYHQTGRYWADNNDDLWTIIRGQNLSGDIHKAKVITGDSGGRYPVSDYPFCGVGVITGTSNAIKLDDTPNSMPVPRPANIALMYIVKTDQADNIKPEPTPTNIIVTPSSLNIGVGATQQFTAQVLPADLAPNFPVIWISTNTAAGTIDSNGLFRATGPGSTDIIASVSSGLSVRVTVRVDILLTSITLAAIPDQVAGNTYPLKVTKTPANATENISYGSTDSAVGSVTTDGQLIAAGEGTATISVTGDVSGKSANRTVKVTAAPVVETYLRIDKNLSEIAGKGEESQAAARANLGLGELAEKDRLTAAEVNAFALAEAPIPGGTNLNAMLTAGQYYQNVSSAATPELNYPDRLAGVLLVYKSGVDTGVLQEYRQYNSNVVYRRYSFGNPLTWGAWDTGALPLTGGTCTGQVIAPSFATTPNATPVGSGTYAQQLGNQAPFFQPNWQWPVTSGGVFVPIAKGTSTRKDKGWPTAISYGYLMPGEDMHAHPVIHALGDSGQECIWEFDTQTGGLRSGKAGEFATLDRDIPPGVMLPWPTENPPAGWFLCNGAGFDRNTFPRLGGVFPNGVLPDLRGVFLRGKDNGRGIDPNRGLGDLQWSQNASHTHTYTKFQYGQTGNKFSLDDVWFGPIDVETGASGGNESRPTNVSVNYIVRAA